MTNDIQRAIERTKDVLPPVTAEMVARLLEHLRWDWDDMSANSDVRRLTAELLDLPEPNSSEPGTDFKPDDESKAELRERVKEAIRREMSGSGTVNSLDRAADAAIAAMRGEQ